MKNRVSATVVKNDDLTRMGVNTNGNMFRIVTN